MPLTFSNLDTDKVHNIQLGGKLEVEFVRTDGTKLSAMDFSVSMTTGGGQSGKLDANGLLTVDGIPSGALCDVQLKDETPLALGD